MDPGNPLYVRNSVKMDFVVWKKMRTAWMCQIVPCTRPVRSCLVRTSPETKMAVPPQLHQLAPKMGLFQLTQKTLQFVRKPVNLVSAAFLMMDVQTLQLNARITFLVLFSLVMVMAPRKLMTLIP